MKRHLTSPVFAAILLALAAHAQAQAQGQAPVHTESATSTLWSRLWYNADQRAEALLRQGHASDAAKLYTDPRRKAYAQIQAGEYAAAASGLKALNDAQANYNRGNALAQSGDLQVALDAYDAALKSDPAHQDARHNRDLVAKALKKQKEEEKDKPQENKSEDKKPQNAQPKDKKDGGQNGQKDQQPGKSGDKPQDGKPQDGKSPDKAQVKQDGGQNGQKDQQPGKPGDQAGNKPGNKPDDNGKSPHAAQNQTDTAGKPDAAQPQSANDAEQARRDVNATLQPSAQGKAGDVAKAQGGATTPMTEKQIAQEQWLRSIPDDPGGLLRRKFLIEHMMRQRDAKP